MKLNRDCFADLIQSKNNFLRKNALATFHVVEFFKNAVIRNN